MGKIFAVIVVLIVLNNSSNGAVSPAAAIAIIIGALSMVGRGKPNPTTSLRSTLPCKPEAQGLPTGFIVISLLLVPLVFLITVSGMGRVAVAFRALGRLQNRGRGGQEP